MVIWGLLKKIYIYCFSYCDKISTAEKPLTFYHTKDFRTYIVR